MKEQLISFDTAKLAKEKGFEYMKANCYGDNMCYQLPEGDLINALRGNTVTGYILAPTQSLLQRWLREVHNIILYVAPISSTTDINNIKWLWCIYTIDTSDRFNTYEEALEQGLINALKTIK